MIRALLLHSYLSTHLNTGGVLLGIIGEGVPPSSPIPDPISDQKMSFFTPVFRHGLCEIISPLLRSEQEQKRFLKIYFEFAYFSFFLRHLELKQ